MTKSGDLAVFTHSNFNRTLIFFINGIAIYFYSRFLFKVSDVVSSFLKSNQGTDIASTIILLVKVSYFAGIIGGFFVLVLLIYTLVDVWGLKILVTANSVIIMNTFLQTQGCGEMDGEDIEEVKKGFFRFHLVSKKGKILKFSGVENIERLFYLIYQLKYNNENQ